MNFRHRTCVTPVYRFTGDALDPKALVRRSEWQVLPPATDLGRLLPLCPDCRMPVPIARQHLDPAD